MSLALELYEASLLVFSIVSLGDIELDVLKNERLADTCEAGAVCLSQGSGQSMDTSEEFSVETTDGSGQVVM
jgi:hypothetical protein